MAVFPLLITAITYLTSITNAQSVFYDIIDLSNDFHASNHTSTVKSTENSNDDETLNITFTFRGGRCWNPKLSLSYEEIDFDGVDEFFTVYYPTLSSPISVCNGSYAFECGNFSQCIDHYELLDNTIDNPYFYDGQEVNFYIVKAAEVGAWCSGFSMNVDVTIYCDSERYHIWNVLGEQDFIVGSSSMSFSKAESYCESQGTHLASIHNDAENEAALDTCTGGDCWIGLQCYDNDQFDFEWMDGTEWDYKNWNNGEPNNFMGNILGDEDCVQMYSNGKWNDNKCSKDYKPLCSAPRGMDSYESLFVYNL